MLANVGVWTLWQTLDQRFMLRHFAVSGQSLREGRMHTLVTSAFSQKDAWHLFGNMLSLFFFGREVGLLFGGIKLAGLYIASGVASSVAHVAWDSRRMEHQRRLMWYPAADRPALGASGCVGRAVRSSRRRLTKSAAP